MKKYFILIAGILIGICTVSCMVDNKRPKEVEAIIEKESVQTLIPENQPAIMRIWFGGCECVLTDREQIELLWRELCTLKGRKEILEVALEGGYPVECIWEGNTIAFAVDAYGFTIE